ncbi:hypothetical protein PENSPDRAFT_556270, partial [Peniophora sp. CONT]
QQENKGVHFYFMDEKSMVGLEMLSNIDSRLRQIRPNEDEILGGYHIAIFGDFAQLPPVGDTPLYARPGVNASQSVRDGDAVYREFTESYMLKTIVRQQGVSEEQLRFKRMLKNASEKGLDEDDWRLLITRESTNLSPEENRLFADAIEIHTTREATSRLVNGTLGTVEDVVWDHGAQRCNLPLAVLVSCPDYTGPTLWRTEPRAGHPNGIPIVPIAALKVSFEHKGGTGSRTQLPLRLAWAMTVH